RADAGGAAVPATGRIRHTAVGVRSQLRARRGFVRAGAMGGAPAALAYLPAGRECALAKAGSISRPLYRRACRCRCEGIGCAVAGDACVERARRHGRLLAGAARGFTRTAPRRATMGTATARGAKSGGGAGAILRK